VSSTVLKPQNTEFVREHEDTSVQTEKEIW
jgi:hypothetical protein